MQTRTQLAIANLIGAIEDELEPEQEIELTQQENKDLRFLLEGLKEVKLGLGWVA